MNNELIVVEQRDILGKDFKIYGSLDEPLFLAKDVAQWIEHSNPRMMLNSIDDNEKVVSNVYTPGGSQESWFLTEDGLYEVLMQSRKPIAKEFKKQVKIILKTIRKTGHYETPEYKLLQSMNDKIELMEGRSEIQDKVISELLETIQSNVFFQPIVNPRHKFELLRARFFMAYTMVGKELSVKNKDRVMYDSIGNWLGINILKSYELPSSMTVRDYLLCLCTIEELEKFICGIEKKHIVKSKANNWVDLNGVFSNEIEWNKVLNYFNHECAYCGSKEKLIAEHVIPQRLYSSTSPEKTDLLGNIVCTCVECNGSKKDIATLEQWYNEDLPQFEQWRLQKIYGHLSKYEV